MRQSYFNFKYHNQSFPTCYTLKYIITASFVKKEKALSPSFYFNPRVTAEKYNVAPNIGGFRILWMFQSYIKNNRRKHVCSFMHKKPSYFPDKTRNPLKVVWCDRRDHKGAMLKYLCLRTHWVKYLITIVLLTEFFLYQDHFTLCL